MHALDNFDTMKSEIYNVGLSDANVSKLELCEIIKSTKKINNKKDLKTFSKELKNLERIIPIVKKIHHSIPNKLSGQPSIFWVFYVIKYYSNFLLKNKSTHSSLISDLLSKSNKLQELSSPREIVFGHNDLLAANFLDDGSKIWVIDWEYGGFNDPLFDIGGLASNNDFDLDMENLALEMYFDKKPVSYTHLTLPTTPYV